MAKPKNKRVLRTKANPSNSHLWHGRTPDNTAIVSVNWRDIQNIENWNDEAEVSPARSVLSIGYLLYAGPDPKDKEHKMTVIARTYVDDTEEWADFYAFPTEVIRSITKIKGGK